jgi:hypothetical protein
MPTCEMIEVRGGIDVPCPGVAVGMTEALEPEPT